jgi:hypothetical protein
MTDPVLTSVISAAGALLVAVAGYVFTKRAERDARWRDEKLAHYKEFDASLSGVIENESTPEGHEPSRVGIVRIPLGTPEPRTNSRENGDHFDLAVRLAAIVSYAAL